LNLRFFSDKTGDDLNEDSSTLMLGLLKIGMISSLS